MEEKTLLTKKDLKEYLNISDGTLYKLMKRREFPYIKMERKVLFRKADIDAWLESKKIS